MGASLVIAFKVEVVDLYSYYEQKKIVRKIEKL
jgi:hypothetical protein